MLGKPLIDKFVNGAQPIDRVCFTKTMTDSIICIMVAGDIVIVVKLAPDLLSIVPFEDGTPL